MATTGYDRAALGGGAQRRREHYQAPPSQIMQPYLGSWRHILGFTAESSPTIEMAKASYHRLAQVNHPDHGGSDKLMALLNKAYSEARKELVDHTQ